MVRLIADLPMQSRQAAPLNMIIPALQLVIATAPCLTCRSYNASYHIHKHVDQLCCMISLNTSSCQLILGHVHRDAAILDVHLMYTHLLHHAGWFVACMSCLLPKCHRSPCTRVPNANALAASNANPCSQPISNSRCFSTTQVTTPLVHHMCHIMLMRECRLVVRV